MKDSFLLLLFIIPGIIFSQECNCETNFNWLKKTFEENDAGYEYVINNKGESAYIAHNKTYRNNLKNISSYWECSNLLYDWLSFFRSGHISLKSLKKENSLGQYEGWEKLDVNVEQFKEYLDKKKQTDLEGIWKINNTEIGIKKVAENYIGFIIATDKTNWTKGEVKLKITSDNLVTYYMSNRSTKLFNSVKLVGEVFLELGYIRLNRISPKIEKSDEVEKYIKLIKTQHPYFEMISNNTALLRVPTFNGAETKIKIDSVISTNYVKILNTPNLIIDIRNNGGGSDRAYKKILPLLYTNPIRTTSLNNQRMLDFISDPKYGFDLEEKKRAQDSYKILSKREGEFVNLDSTYVKITKLDTVYTFPKNIGIIINENNGSSAEQFLLTAKQSKKVKLFGTITTGVLDISNMYFVKSPCEDFELGYCLTRSMRIPEMAIDNKGIQPDYYIDKSIPQYKWVEFVEKILNE